MFEDLKDKIDVFYDISESKNELLLLELNKRINRDPDNFKNYMAQIGFGYESNRAIFYEAITMRNPRPWGDYLYDEIELIIREAESGNEDDTEEIDSIEWLVDIEGMED